jgi:hypothetical protein
MIENVVSPSPTDGLTMTEQRNDYQLPAHPHQFRQRVLDQAGRNVQQYLAGNANGKEARLKGIACPGILKVMPGNRKSEAAGVPCETFLLGSAEIERHDFLSPAVGVQRATNSRPQFKYRRQPVNCVMDVLRVESHSIRRQAFIIVRV